jgi:hypothetical protein
MVAAVEGLQDPGDAAHLAVEIRAPVLRQRPQAQVLGRHPPVPPWKENPEMQEVALLCSSSRKRRRRRRCHL